MADDCRGEETTTETPENCAESGSNCCISKVVSDSLDVAGGCPECSTVRIELPEEPECTMVTSMMNNDTFQFKRNGKPYCIKWSDLLVQLGCKKECLD